MNAVEIEEAVSELAARPFDPAEFPYAFLSAFGNKDTTIKRLRAGHSNTSDVPGGVLQRNNIHIAVCADGAVTRTVVALRESPKTVSAKAKFVLATDGVSLEAEDLASGETIACVYQDFASHFGFFLPLAGISTVKEIKNNPFDVKATGRLNKLYLELLKDNPDWGTEAKRPALNQFVARLIFCFFAEDTGIFRPKQFTKIVEQMSDGQAGNTHEILCELFRAMDLKSEDREGEKIKNWANGFPYVNGGMFTGGADCPKFSRIARSYLLAVGNLEWDKINPDIFGSMIQAVADEDERGDLGMHYTSVPNILKVLNPLFLDGLREQLSAAELNVRKLRNLRKRLSAIRVFDPACGSGNFLVIAYKEMRAIENEIVKRTGDEPKSLIKLDSFYGIEIKNFAVEIARLALLIAEFQCDVQYISQQEARAMVLPLHKTGQIRVGNAMKESWFEICPPNKEGSLVEHDLVGPTGRLDLDGIDNAQSETYICGNPPYKGNAKKSDEQKDDLKSVLDGRIEKWGLLDYVCGWFFKAHEYAKHSRAQFAFVATNSVAQGQHVTNFWKALFEDGLKFNFAVRSFKWSNLAKNDAGVTVVCIGAGSELQSPVIYDGDIKIKAANINAYLLPHDDYWVEGSVKPMSEISHMMKGNYYGLSEHLLIGDAEKRKYLNAGVPSQMIRRFYGSTEVINAKPRNCFWFTEQPTAEILKILDIGERLKAGVETRSKSKDAISNGMVKRPHQFREMYSAKERLLAVPVVSSENRDYLPIDLLDSGCVLSNKCFALYDAPLWNLALVASRLHWVWIGTVCVRMRTDFSYSNVLGWNTFPVPKLTDRNKGDLTRSAEEILLAREAHFPATIADLYDAKQMPVDLRRAHELNDELLERIYIGRRFRNDTERLEKLFELYAKMTSEKPRPTKKAKRAA